MMAVWQGSCGGICEWCVTAFALALHSHCGEDVVSRSDPARRCALDETTPQAPHAVHGHIALFSTRGQLLAVSDLNVVFPENKEIVCGLRPESAGTVSWWPGPSARLSPTSNGRGLEARDPGLPPFW